MEEEKLIAYLPRKSKIEEDPLRITEEDKGECVDITGDSTDEEELVNMEPIHFMELQMDEQEPETGPKRSGVPTKQNVRFLCDICWDEFADKKSLETHLKNHKTEITRQNKIFICDFCGKKFASMNTLEGHKKTHIGEQPYECEVCEKVFPSYKKLSLHQQAHEVRHWDCNFCSRTFRRVHFMKQHVKMFHSGGNTFRCEYCPKAFTLQSSLTKHKRIHQVPPIP